MEKNIKEPEVWKPVVGYQEFYEISSHGRIKALPRKRNVRGGGHYISKEKIFSEFSTRSGHYLAFHFYSHGEHSTKTIHRLVAYHFCERPYNHDELQINHLDGDKFNNYYKNLKYSTAKENINHAFDNGLNKKVEKNDSRSSIPINQYDLLGNFLTQFPSMNEAFRQTGIPTSNIWSAIKNDSYAKGYKWRYAE